MPQVGRANQHITVQDVTGGKLGATKRYELPVGILPSAVPDSEDSAVRALQDPLSFRWITVKPGHSYRVTIDPSAEDIFGRTLGYRSISTISLGRSGGFANIRSGERVLAPTSNGMPKTSSK